MVSFNQSEKSILLISSRRIVVKVGKIECSISRSSLLSCLLLIKSTDCHSSRSTVNSPTGLPSTSSQTSQLFIGSLRCSSGNNFYLLFLSLELSLLFRASEEGDAARDLERDLQIVLD